MPIRYNRFCTFFRLSVKIKLADNANKIQEGCDLWDLTQSSVVAETGDRHETYGISKGSTVIRDISLNKKEILDLVKLLNKLDVSEIHARDIAEDFLGR